MRTGEAVPPDLGGAAYPTSVGIASAAGRLITGVCAVDAGVPARFALPAILAARVDRLLRFPVLG